MTATSMYLTPIPTAVAEEQHMSDAGQTEASSGDPVRQRLYGGMLLVEPTPACDPQAPRA